MLDRGEISFVFLWVLNPIVILFYQNCSMLPFQAHGNSQAPKPAYEAQSNDQVAALARMPSCSKGKGNCSDDPME